MFWHHVYRSVHLDRSGPFDVFFVVFVTYRYYGDRWSDHEAKGVVWRAIGVRRGSREWNWRSRGTARRARLHAVQSIKLLKKHGVETCARRALMHAVQPLERRGMEEKWSCTACTAARRSSLFESRNEHNWRCTACTTARRSPAFGARNRLLWKVHGVHLARSSCNYKKGRWRKEKVTFPQLDFPNFSRVFSAKTSTQPLLEPKLKI